MASHVESHNEDTDAIKTHKWLIPLLVGVVLLAVIVTIGVIWWLAIDPARTANVRDIVIILFAISMILISIVTGALLAVLVYQLQALIRLLRTEIRPLIGDAKRTFTTVRGTTEFVSDSVAQPAIKVASFIAGLRGMGDALKGKAGRAQKPR
jgi:hypothetical protein